MSIVNEVSYAEIRRLMDEEGLNGLQAAKQLDISPQTLYQILRTGKPLPEKKPEKPSGFWGSVDELVDRYTGKPVEPEQKPIVIPKRGAAKGINLSKETLEGYLAQGMTNAQIGELLGCSSVNISHYRKKYGLTADKTAPKKKDKPVSKGPVVCLEKDDKDKEGLRKTGDVYSGKGIRFEVDYQNKTVKLSGDVNSGELSIAQIDALAGELFQIRRIMMKGDN